jgi:mannosyltransferase
MVSSGALDATGHAGSRLSIRRLAVVATYGVLTSLLIWSRFAELGSSLWHDEIYTIQRFVVPGPTAIFGKYNTNDHMLFSVLAWLTVRLSGLGDSAYRLWAVVPSVAGVALVTGWLHRRAGAAAAILFAFLCTTSTQLLLLSTEARGYGIAFFAMAVMTVSAYEASTRKTPRSVSLVAASGVVGCITLPTFVLPFLGVSLVLLGNPRLRQWLTIRLELAFAAIAAWYAVPAPTLLASRSQEFGVRLPWHAPLTGAATELAAAFVPTVDAADLLPGIIVLPILVAGIRNVRRGMPGMTAILVCPVLLTFFALALARLYVEERFVSYLLVPLFVIAAFGLKDLATVKASRAGALSAAYMIAAAGSALLVFAFFSVQHSRLPREANREAAGAVLRALSRGDARPVILNTHHPDDLVYYLGDVPLLTVAPSRLEPYLCADTRETGVIFVQQPYGVQTVDAGCLMRRGATRHIFRQSDRGRRITVWVVPSRGSRASVV